MNARAAERDPASFRDPTGFVYRKNGKLYRAISQSGRRDFLCWIRSGLAEQLLQAEKIVPFQVVEDGGTIELREIAFVTYPYEWSFGQLRDAALLTLELTEASLAHGMILQDATAFNVTFENGRPIFMDHGSFRIHHHGEAWMAYRQFVMHFLAPLLLMRFVDLRCLDLFRVHLDGVPLDLASRLLPWSSWLRLHPLIHVHLHARMERKYSAAPETARPPTAKTSGLRALLSELKRYIASLTMPGQKTDWADYYTDNNYSFAGFQFKKQEIARFCRAVAPRTTIDLGANSGVFSQIAAEYSERVIAADSDPSSAEALYQLSKTACANIVPCLLDLNNPTPGLGIFNRERRDFLSRARGDLVLGLALIHHLRISGWPLDRIVELFADMTANAAVVEFVPKSDVQVQRLLRSRSDIYDDWHLKNVKAAFLRRFRTCNVVPIPKSERVLLELC